MTMYIRFYESLTLRCIYTNSNCGYEFVVKSFISAAESYRMQGYVAVPRAVSLWHKGGGRYFLWPEQMIAETITNNL